MKKPNLKKLLKGYYYVNSNITEENFPIPEKIETENWKIITINKVSTTDEVLAKIKAAGYRPANLYELAFFKENHPDECRKHWWIVALGQTWKDSGGCHRVPHLDANSAGDFNFHLGIFEKVWIGSNAFLCFCDPVSSQTPSPSENSSPLTLESAIQTVKDAGYHVIKML